VTTIERSIVIKAPLKQVFAYVDDPLHLPEIWPSLVEVKEVKPLPKGGHRYHWIYKMAGMRFEGETETLEFEPDRRFVEKATGQILSTFDWKFTPVDGTTKIELKTEYEIPSKLLGKLAEPFVRKLNEREAETFLANLKDRVET
jgi:ribosome-associated toxin RatA of RatAB toxin-antitoxin module